MKSAVVFFSRDGSTRKAAKAISEITGADMFELEEKRKRGRSPFSFMAAGFGAFTGKRSRLKSAFSQEMREYGRIYIGTPVWAGKAAPAFNSFIHSLAPKGKEVFIFTLQADPDTAGPSKSIDEYKALLEKKGAKVTGAVKLHGAVPGKTAETEHIKKQLAGFDQ